MIGVAAPVCWPVVQSTVISRSELATGIGPSSAVSPAPDSSSSSTFSIARPPVSWSPTTSTSVPGVRAAKFSAIATVSSSAAPDLTVSLALLWWAISSIPSSSISRKKPSRSRETMSSAFVAIVFSGTEGS